MRLDTDSRAFWEAHAPYASPSALAKQYPASQGGMTVSGWNNAIRSAKDRYPELAWVVQSKGKKPVIPTEWPEPIYAETAKALGEAHELSTEEKVERDREIVRLKQQISETNRRYNASLKEQNLFEKLAEEGRSALSPISPYCDPPKPDNSKEHSQALVLSWADWHCESVVNYEIMEGLNWYDPPTCLRRVECCVDKTILIANLASKIDYHTLYIHDCGDNVENHLHEDSKSSNSMTPLKAARFAAELKAVALRDLSGHFERIIFRGVPGNHGRTQAKMPWSLPTENLDWLIYQWTKTLCADIPNIEFDLVDAWSQTCDVEGWGWFLNHGTTDAKGGFGGLSWYSVVKSDTKRTAIDVKLKRTVLAREYGHMHQKADIERAGGNGRIFINPSLKGGDEFPKEGMAGTYSEPGQVLRSVHRTEGIVAEYPLNIRQYDLEPKCRYDALLKLV